MFGTFVILAVLTYGTIMLFRVRPNRLEYGRRYLSDRSHIVSSRPMVIAGPSPDTAWTALDDLQLNRLLAENDK